MSSTANIRFRVRYAETDQMGMVYYANYLIWMEMGRSEFCRTCGFSYADVERETQSFLAVAEASCRYIVPARYDDEILVETRLEQANRRVLRFTYLIHNAQTGTLLAEGRTVHVTLGRDGRPKSLPAAVYEKLMQHQD